MIVNDDVGLPRKLEAIGLPSVTGFLLCVGPGVLGFCGGLVGFFVGLDF